MPESGSKMVMQWREHFGMTSAVRAGLGVTLLNGRHIGPDIEA